MFLFKLLLPLLPSLSPSLPPSLPHTLPLSIPPPSLPPSHPSSLSLPSLQTISKPTEIKQLSSWNQSYTPSGPTQIATSSTLLAETCLHSLGHTYRWAEIFDIGRCHRPARTNITTPWRHWTVGDQGRNMRRGYAAGKTVCIVHRRKWCEMRKN